MINSQKKELSRREVQRKFAPGVMFHNPNYSLWGMAIVIGYSYVPPVMKGDVVRQASSWEVVFLRQGVIDRFGWFNLERFEPV